LKAGGELACWGDPGVGGDCSHVVDSQEPGANLFSNGQGFVAIKASGILTGWPAESAHATDISASSYGESGPTVTELSSTFWVREAVVAARVDDSAFPEPLAVEPNNP